MKPKIFKQSNTVLKRPENMSEELCSDLPAFRGKGIIISCWKCSFSERFKMLFLGKVWLWVFADKTHNPVYLGIENPFNKVKK